MENFKKLNNITGWIVFAIAAFTYILTIEPTVSFWDCGEFISTADRLLVGHPPGAPFFMIVGKFFTLFAFGQQNVAMMVNVMSALASAFTILFLFWTITHIARKIMFTEKAELWQVIAVLGSGAVGALAYTFSDTFWFSAVEGEVYAMSSLFTALVFWVALKWEDAADEPQANRWLILIAYLMGLSIGVHLLNLLAIPAIAMVYYYRKYDASPKGALKTFAISAVVLGFILYGIIPGVVIMSGWFELFFVNSMGMPYNTGAFIYIFFLIAAIVAGIWWTYKNGHPILNMIVTGIAVILIGYSSFAMIMIRSSAQPPMDQNSPKDVFSLISYLNREQYGNRPLFMGENYNSPIDREKTFAEEGEPVYIQKDGKYVVADHRPEYKYEEGSTSIFPRMYSRSENHIEEYKRWANIKGKPFVTEDEEGNKMTIQIPTFGEHLTFFLSYQVNYMYWRYFMWNFAGRQNDIQGNGEINKGNWISGVSFIDNMRLGDQDKLPEVYKNNKGRNKLYFLPLILGLLGIFFQFNAGVNGRRSFWLVTLLFTLTGLAILLYLNQTPLQPRERDYAYAGSFYAFTIWIGLGVLAIIDGLKRFMSSVPAAATATGLALLVPVLMCAENWDDHDRSHRYVARDLAHNYLNSCLPNSIIFTNGDNDTFPLWYAQEVEGVRTDVRVCNLSYLQTDWYIDQMKRKSHKSAPLPFSLTHDKYVTGNRDIVYLVDRFKRPIDAKQAMTFLADDSDQTKMIQGYDQRIDHFPAKEFFFNVDSAKVVNSDIVPADAKKFVTSKMSIKINKSAIYKNELMIFDLMANNKWDRPIYYAVTVGDENYIDLEKYFQLEGFAYQVVPILTQTEEGGEQGRVATDRMYDNFVNKFKWGGYNDPRVYLDENHLRMAMNIRNNFGRLASALIDEGKNDKALVVLNKAQEVLPAKLIPHNYFSLVIAEGYYRLGMNEKGDQIVKEFSKDNYEELDFFFNLPTELRNSTYNDMRRNLAIYMEMYKVLKMFNRDDLVKTLEAKYDPYMNKYQNLGQ